MQDRFVSVEPIAANERVGTYTRVVCRFVKYFLAGLRENAFRLPTLAECIDAESQLHLTLPSPGDGGKRKPSASQRRRLRKKASVANTDESAISVAEPAPQPKPTNRIIGKKAFVGVYVD